MEKAESLQTHGCPRVLHCQLARRWADRPWFQALEENVRCTLVAQQLTGFGSHVILVLVQSVTPQLPQAKVPRG